MSLPKGLFCCQLLNSKYKQTGSGSLSCSGVIHNPRDQFAPFPLYKPIYQIWLKQQCGHIANPLPLHMHMVYGWPPQPLEERNYSEFFYGRESLTVLSWPMLFGILEFSLWCPTKPDPSCCLLPISISWNGTLSKLFWFWICVPESWKKKALVYHGFILNMRSLLFCLVKGLLDHPL